MQEQLPRTRSFQYIELKGLFFFVYFVVKNVFSVIWIILSQSRARCAPSPAGLSVQVAQAVHIIGGAEVPGIGNAGDLSEVVVGRVDLSQGAADDAGMRFELADRLVQGVVFVGGDGWGWKLALTDCSWLRVTVQVGAVQAPSQPPKVEPEFFGLRPHFYGFGIIIPGVESHQSGVAVIQPAPSSLPRISLSAKDDKIRRCNVRNSGV